MGLYERLMGSEEPKIHVHQFQAMMNERGRGQITNAEIVAAFSLSALEQDEILTLVGRLTDAVTPLSMKALDDVLLLAEERIAPYNTTAAVRTRLGV